MQAVQIVITAYRQSVLRIAYGIALVLFFPPLVFEYVGCETRSISMFMIFDARKCRSNATKNPMPNAETVRRPILRNV